MNARRWLILGLLALCIGIVLVAVCARRSSEPSGTAALATSIATVASTSSPLTASTTASPTPLAPDSTATATATADTVARLSIALPHLGAPAYQRSAWQHWVDEDGDCQDTRQEVLIAESLVPVTFTSASQCRVASGRWLDPYTGQTFTDPGQLDVDHLVPLENAHISGGWSWTLPQSDCRSMSVRNRCRSLSELQCFESRLCELERIPRALHWVT